MRYYDLITPEGTKDLLFSECIVRRNIEDSLMAMFKGMGFTEIITPGLEFYDVFNQNSEYFPQENMYKLTDNKGRLLVMRPDTTMPIARVVATRLKDAYLPLKFCYDQSVYRTEPALKGRSDEIVQAGIEIIGSGSRMADTEVIAAAAEALSGFGMNFSLELGHIGIFKELMSRLDASGKEKETIRTLIETKNFPALREAVAKISDSTLASQLEALPGLFGGEEVFAKAREIFAGDENISALLDELEYSFHAASQLCGESGSITADLGLVNKTDYYTGLIIKGYLMGHGDEVISGGRYDKLLAEFGMDVPAVGFAVNVNAVEKVMVKTGNMPEMPKVDVLICAKEGCEVQALKKASQMRKEGKIVEIAVNNDMAETEKYAKAKNITNIVAIDNNGGEQ